MSQKSSVLFYVFDHFLWAWYFFVLQIFQLFWSFLCFQSYSMFSTILMRLTIFYVFDRLYMEYLTILYGLKKFNCPKNVLFSNSMFSAIFDMYLTIFYIYINYDCIDNFLCSSYSMFVISYEINPQMGTPNLFSYVGKKLCFQ